VVEAHFDQANHNSEGPRGRKTFLTGFCDDRSSPDTNPPKSVQLSTEIRTIVEQWNAFAVAGFVAFYRVALTSRHTFRPIDLGLLGTYNPAI
jgi:hypothetical protein